jgi:hypothetical protein
MGFGVLLQLLQLALQVGNGFFEIQLVFHSVREFRRP